MISKLLDEPYWNELKSQLEESLRGGYSKTYIGNTEGYDHGMYENIADFLVNVDLEERTHPIISKKKYDTLSLKTQSLYWNAERIHSYCVDNLSIFKGELVFKIADNLDNFNFEGSDDEFSYSINKLKKSLTKENNIENIWSVCLALLAYHENNGSTYYHGTLEDFLEKEIFLKKAS